MTKANGETGGRRFAGGNGRREAAPSDQKQEKSKMKNGNNKNTNNKNITNKNTNNKNTNNKNSNKGKSIGGSKDDKSSKCAMDKVKFHIYKQTGRFDDKTPLIPKKFRKPKNQEDDKVESEQEGHAEVEDKAERSEKQGTAISIAQIAQRMQGDPIEAEFLNLSKMGISDLPDLSSCANLKRLDLTDNAISSLKEISDCKELNWLSVKDNKITDLTPIRRMRRMEVLTLSLNNIEILDPIANMNQLKALIANSNKISSFSGLSGLENITTLVLSHNQISEIGGISGLKNLRKLSVAHNQIRVIPDLRHHPLLEELRLNDNKIQRVPETIDRNPCLKLIDLGKNRLYDIGDLFRLGQCRKIMNLNLLGNTRLNSQEGYREKALKCLPNLVIFDGKKVVEDEGKKKRTRKNHDPNRSKKGKESNESKEEGDEGEGDDNENERDAKANKPEKDGKKEHNVKQEKDNSKQTKKAPVFDDAEAKSKGAKKKISKPPTADDETQGKNAKQKKRDHTVITSQEKEENPFDLVLRKKQKIAKDDSREIRELGDGWEKPKGGSQGQSSKNGDEEMGEPSQEGKTDDRKQSGVVEIKTFEGAAKLSKSAAEPAKPSKIRKNVELAVHQDILTRTEDVGLGGDSSWD